MKPKAKQIVTILISIFLFSCSSEEMASEVSVIPTPTPTSPVIPLPTTIPPSSNSIKLFSFR